MTGLVTVCDDLVGLARVPCRSGGLGCRLSERSVWRGCFPSLTRIRHEGAFKMGARVAHRWAVAAAPARPPRHA